jgi:hypothetical protein
VWQIAESEDLSADGTAIKKIFLESEHFLVHNHIPGVQWFGRYFVVEDFCSFNI